jgi:hypothetical protein
MLPLPSAAFAMASAWGLLALAATAGGADDDKEKNAAAWKELRPALFRFQEGGARKEFLTDCKKIRAAYPGSRYDNQLDSLISALEREAADPPPPFLAKPAAQRTPEETARYWMFQLREQAGKPLGDPGYPDLSDWSGETPTAFDRLVALGPPAIPHLLESLRDDTPTRTLAWQRSFYPVHFVLRRQDLALKALERIVGCPFYEEGATFMHFHMDTPARRQSVLDNVKQWWKKSQGASQAQMIRNQLALSGDNITLSKHHRVRALEVLAALEGPEAVITEMRQLLDSDTYGLNSPVREAMKRIDPQNPIRLVFKRFWDRQSRDGDYVLLLRYGDQAAYVEMTKRLEATGRVDPGSWNLGDQAASASKHGQNWSIPILAHLLAETKMTGSRFRQGFTQSQPFSTADIAMEEFQKQTGKDFGYRPEKSERERLDAIAKAREWWKKEGHAQLAAKIAEDHPPVMPSGDLFLSEDEITARVAAIDGPDATRRRQTIAALGDAYSYRVQRALLNAVLKEQDAAERIKILHVLKNRAWLWHVPVLAKIMETDKDTAVRVAAAGAIKTVVADKTTWIWWIRVETRESGLEAARRITADAKATPELRRAAADILRAWASWIDRPLLQRLSQAG